MFGRNLDAVGAASFLLAKGDLRPSVANLVSGATVVHGATDAAPRQEVKAAKISLAQYPRNPVLRTQLALSYANLGQKRRAVEEMRVAVASAPANRNVLRAATRLLVRSGRADEALSALRRASSDGDPWIVSALVATADLVGDTSAISPKRARALLDSGLPPSQLAELAGALATLEVEAGNVKRAKKMIAGQLQGINENVAAQLRWLEKNHRVDFGVDVLGVEGSFEARSLEMFTQHRFREAIDSARSWHEDEPFATRAAIHASYMASTYMGRFDLALSFLDPAIVANPNSVTLLNNRAFALSELGRFDEAKAALALAVAASDKSEKDPVLLATGANIVFRMGNILEGGYQYIDALEEALRQKKIDTAARVIIHLFKELVDQEYMFSEDEISEVQRSLYENRHLPQETKDLLKFMVLDPLAERRKSYAPDDADEVVSEVIRRLASLDYVA
jgi:tetratricopeptide (TPR) repeat protein